MIKQKKAIALMIAMLMVMSNFMGLLGNISLAIHENITVVFRGDNDSNIRLKEDGKTLNYICSDESSYDFQLIKNGEAVTITPHYNENGDTYTAEVSSNENLCVVSPFINLGIVEIKYVEDDEDLGMFGENEGPYSSLSLHEIKDVGSYEFIIGERQQNNSGNNNGMAEEIFNVDFGTAEWTIENETTTASLAEGTISEGHASIRGDADIILSNWHDDLMEARITVTDINDQQFSAALGVRNEDGVYKTKIMDLSGGAVLPQRNTNDVTFSVVRREEPVNPPPAMEDTDYEVNFGEATWTVRNETTTATVTRDDQNIDLTSGMVTIRGNEEIHLSNWHSDLMQVTITIVEPGRTEEEWFRTRLIVVDDGNGNGITRIMDIDSDNIRYEEGFHLEFVVEPYEGERPEMNLPEPDTSAYVTLSSPAGYEGSYVDAMIAINGYEILRPEEMQMEDPIPETRIIGDVPYNYDDIQYEGENAGKVKISFGAIFINKYVGTVTVVGKDSNNETLYTETVNVSDMIDYRNRQDWLDHYSGQTVGFDIFVNKADGYDFIVSLDEMVGADIAIGNFLWSYEEDGAGHDGYVGNAYLQVTKVVYWVDDNHDGEEEEYTVEGEDIDHDPYIEYGRSAVTESLVVPEGSRVTMKITPYYGYQVLTFGSNDNPIITGEAISEFTFPAHKGNFHLSAQVVDVDDIVNAASEKVKSGTIEIGNNEINTGSVVLLVDDANPTQEKTEQFEQEVAGYEDGEYRVDSYLDISLDQVVYKGSADNVWSSDIPELNQDATIELELEDDMKDKDIVVVHNIHDGENYEIIEIDEYDEETNTITFKANSFSNYAIAVKDKVTDPGNNPGDNPGENPENPQENYSLTAGDYIAEFTDDEGHDFELDIMEVYHLTPDMLEMIGYTEEEYEEEKEEVAEFVKEYGEVINLYTISIYDEDYGHTGETLLKIKVTEEMEEYSNLKLICIDEETLGEEDIVDIAIEGDYIVGNLPHTGNYVLVGEKNEEQIEQELYTITSDTITVIFTDDEGHDFELEIMELLNLTPAELAEMGISEEDYKQAVEEITEALKEYGTILNVYGINVYDDADNYGHFGGVKIKIKMTDEMKEYDTFKFICIDDSPIPAEDIIALSVVTEGTEKYLTGDLKHLSNYALVAKKTEEAPAAESTTNATESTEKTTTEETKTTSNPTTGDNIIFYVVMFMISVIGVIQTIRRKK